MKTVEAVLEVEVDGTPLFARPLIAQLAVDHAYSIRQTMPAGGTDTSAYSVFQMLEGNDPRVVVLACANAWTLEGFAASSDAIDIRAGSLLALVNIKAGFDKDLIAIDQGGAGGAEFFGFVAGMKA